MSTEIGGIFVKIGADIGGLTTGLDKASETLKNFGRKMEETGKNLSLYLTTPIITLGTALANLVWTSRSLLPKLLQCLTRQRFPRKNLKKTY